MKKILLGFGLGLFLFAAVGCDKETVESASIDSREAIQFNAYLGKQATRFAPTTVESLYGGFGVYVFNQDGSYVQRVGSMGNDPTLTLLWNGSTWYYNEPALYLPIGPHDGSPAGQIPPSYTYHAVYPNYPVTTIGTNSIEFEYTAPGDEDLIYARTPATQDASVNLQFDHVLSRVNFAVQVPSDVTAMIENITLGDVYGSGSFNNGSISGISGKGNYVYAEEISENSDGEGNIYRFLVDYKSDEPVFLRQHDGESPNRPEVDNSLYLLPQVFRTNNEQAYIDVTFTLKSNIYVYVDEEGNESTQLIAENVTVRAYLKDFNMLGSGINWESGQSYTYLIDFSNYLVDRKVEITADVSEWGDNAEEIDGAFTIEMVQLTQSTLDNAINALYQYYTFIHPDYSQEQLEGPIQTLLYVNQPLKGAVEINSNDLKGIYHLIYDEYPMTNPNHPYKFVIYMSNGVADDLGGRPYSELITLTPDCLHWNITYVDAEGKDVSAQTGTDTPFYVIITPKP